VGHLHVAARRELLLVAGHDAVRVFLVEQVVDDRVEYQADRLAEVEQGTDLGRGEQRARRPDVGEHHDGRGVVGEQRLAVQGHARVVVYVHHPGGRVDRLGDLVRVLHRGQAGAQVEELLDALQRHEPDGAAERGPVEPRAVAAVTHRRHRLGGDRAVNREVVLSAEDRVVHARHARLRRVDLWRYMIRVGLGPGHVVIGHCPVPRRGRSENVSPILTAHEPRRDES
jgi:hypothetical protein